MTSAGGDARRSREEHTMRAVMIVCVVAAVVLVAPATVPAQDHGSGGGGIGCGDVFGDLVHILRYVDDDGNPTGQPILARRWIEYPQDVYDWGYCPIAVDESGMALPFAPLSCDVHPDYLDMVVEVDYFGRLNGGRTKERNQRMHLNEVIDNIKASCEVKQDETGRLKMKFCNEDGSFEWAIVDSPMENMGVYVRLMKYGHLQTDPNEVDLWAHGDPATGPQLHPALGPEDWAKFHPSVEHLLPDNPYCFTDSDGDGVYEVVEPFTDEDKDGFYDLGEPFADLDGDGERDAFSEPFDPTCAVPESLSSSDFVRAGSFLGGAANKTGRATIDLVQYFNRFVKITKATEASAANPNLLPAMIAVCPDDFGFGYGEDYQATCTIESAKDYAWPEGVPVAPANEKFVDYSAAEYVRNDWREEYVEGIFPYDPVVGTWKVYSMNATPVEVVNLADWLMYANGEIDADGITGFVASANDAIRSIQFVHNYTIPEDLGWEIEFSSPKPE